MFRLYSYCLLACSAVHDLPTERPAAKTESDTPDRITDQPGARSVSAPPDSAMPDSAMPDTAVSAASDTDPAVSAAPPFQPRTADPHPAVSVATAGFSRRAVNRW